VTPTVHVLLYGQTLCRQIHGLPKDWGPQHKWVRVEERADATCAMCKEQAETLAEENRRRIAAGMVDLGSSQWIAAVERAWLADNPLLMEDE
jgi:hypothetical protein